MSYTMRLLKCPSCGGPLDSPAGESSMKCPYCGNQVVIPENLRKPARGAPTSSQSIFSGIDMGALLGYGAQWAEIVELAQRGNKAEAVKRYVALTGQSESEAIHMLDGLTGYQSFEFIPGTYTVQQIYTPSATEAYKTASTITRSVTRTTLWLTCGIFAFIVIIIIATTLPVLIGVFTSFLSFFR